jgi:hypothetical protein
MNQEIDFWRLAKWVLSKMLGACGSIKVWGFLIVLADATALCWFDKIDGSAWAMVISIGFGGFLAAREYGKIK